MVRSARGMVASPHADASRAGVDVLRRGGTAADAAVAANAVLAVVYPASCGLGGDALCMIYEPRAGKTVCYNGSGRASAGLHAFMLRERGYRAMPLRGGLTVTVPGAVRLWEDLLTAHGRFGLDDVLAVGERYAREGFAITPVVAEYLGRNEALLRADPEAAALFLCKGLPQAGTVLRNVPLAETLGEIRSGGAAAFYRGRVAEAIVAAVSVAANPMTLDDLCGATTERVSPVAVKWHGAEVLAHPPNSQGALAPMVLGMLASDGHRPAHDWYHLAIEAIKLAFDERDAGFGDPTAMPLSVEPLLEPQNLEQMRSRIDSRWARPTRAKVTGGGTVAIVAVDEERRAVSLLQSLYMGFGAGVMAPGTGVFLHNRGTYFTLRAGHPNELAGGKRPLHTLSPAMLLRDGRPELVYATMGGDGQIQTHVQLLHDVYELGMDVQQAVDLPRFVYGRDSESPFRDLVRVEDRVPRDIIESLQARGHVIETVGPYDHAVGHAQLIALDREAGTLHGGADPRADSAAIGL